MAEYFKNPIVLGLLTSGMSYAYLKWDVHHREANGELVDEKISMKYPIMLGLLMFVGVTLWRQHESQTVTKGGNNYIKLPINIDTSTILPSNKAELGNALPEIFIPTSNNF